MNPSASSVRIVARLFALLAISMTMAGCTRPINRAAERRIRDVLPSYIGPAKQWLAHVDNPAERTVRGKLGRVTIDGREVDLANTVQLSELHIEMRDADVDPGRGRLRSVGSTTFRAVVAEKGLNRYLLDFPPPEGEPVRYRRVRLRDGGMDVDGTRKVLGRDISFTLSTEPNLVGVNELRFEPERMRMAGLPVPLPARVLQFFAKYLSDGMNFNQLPFKVRVIKVSATREGIVFTGTADVMESLNQRLGGWIRDEGLVPRIAADE